MIDGNVISRFWNKVAKTDNCWEWTASKYTNGYGQFVIKGEVRTPAHRTAWRIANGEIPEGRWVLHKCDNRGCVNPSHLFLGTRQDNVDDMVSKSRNVKGESCTQSKLTGGSVIQIRNRCQAGETQEELAYEFGVSQTTISKLIKATRWNSLGITPIKLINRASKGERHHAAKLNNNDIVSIREMSKTISNLKLASLFSVSSVMIGLIVNRKAWKHIA